jgi:UDP-N-acetylmuramoyl-tripeptide--D-alanyl-D-alanine ligase
LEGFGSLEGVARAKGEIARGLTRDGTLIVASDSPWTGLWRALAEGRRVLTCGLDAAADVRAPAELVESTWGKEGFRTSFKVCVRDELIGLDLGLAGMHNVRNALAAVAVASALDIPAEALRAGLASLRPVPRRLQPRIGPGGLKVIDDTYNANPDSVRAAIQVLIGLPGRRRLVLGDLGELGPRAGALHRELGAAARDAGIDTLHAVGRLSAEAVAGFGNGARHFADQEALISALSSELGNGDLVLVKGSRAAAMDRVADALCAEEGP